MSQLSKRQLAQRKKARRDARRTFTNPALLVGGKKETGGKRRGKSMKVSPSTERATRITRKQLDLVPDDAQLWGDKRGNGKLLTYNRDSA
jgi:hypothetical protein